MNSSRAIEILTKAIEDQSQVPSLGADGGDFIKWRRNTEVAIRKIFGDDSRHVSEFTEIDYVPNIYPTTAERRRAAYDSGMGRANTLLSSLIDEIANYGMDDDIAPLAPDALHVIERTCSRFHAVARQLQARHDERDTLTISDEYDVQDLMHALLRLHFDDIREEEWTPGFAGASSRQDFLLKSERVVVEVKKTRPTLKAKQLGEELIIDIARYRAHPDCSCLICFVYDPDGRIANPTGLERDLESLGDEKLKVRVIIRPNS